MITKEVAISMGESGWWKNVSAVNIVRFQLYESMLCMPFAEFHKAVEESLKRPVFTHEFALHKKLIEEFEKMMECPE